MKKETILTAYKDLIGSFMEAYIALYYLHAWFKTWSKWLLFPIVFVIGVGLITAIGVVVIVVLTVLLIIWHIVSFIGKYAFKKKENRMPLD